MPKKKRKNQVSSERRKERKAVVDDKEEKEGGIDMAPVNVGPKQEGNDEKGKPNIQKPNCPKKERDEGGEVDNIVSTEGDVHKALVKVIEQKLEEQKGQKNDISEQKSEEQKAQEKDISEQKWEEQKVNRIVSILINRGADISKTADDGKTLLLLCVEKNWQLVCRTLLKNDVIAVDKDSGRSSCKLAIEKKSDAIAAMLITKMNNEIIRKLFTEGDGFRLRFNDLLENDMQETALAVLDCCKEQRGPKVIVYYQILEADEKGKLPDDNRFNTDSKSPLYLIAENGNKTLINHDVVRLLVRKKWNAYAGTKFKVRGCIYLLSVFAFTFSAVVAVSAEHPLVYDTTINVYRAQAEIFICLVAFHTLICELYQFKRHKMNYLKSGFNIIDMCSVLLLLAAIPCRFMQLKEQWLILSVAYLLWTLKIFKFAIVFRQTGAYAQMLWTILTNDIIQFTGFFLVILLAFGGAFFLSMKGEDSSGENSDTSSFWNIVFLGLRILIESDRIVEYTEFRPMSCIIMLMFLFTCCVILLNILIAQLSDTYQNVQQDAWRGLEINWAWIVVSGEMNSIYSRMCNMNTYVDSEEITDIKKVLGKWNAPKINHMQDLHDSIDLQKENIWKLNDKVAEQENIIKEIRSHLYEALAMLYERNGGIKNE